MDPVTMALIFGAMGGAKSMGANKARSAQNEAEVAKTRYSPWTGMSGNVDTRYDDPLLGAAGGALGGVAAAQGMGGLGALGSGGAAAAPQGASYLGGSEMAAKLAPQSAWNFMQPQNELAMLGAPQQMNAPMGQYRY